VTSPDLLSKYLLVMELRFGKILYSNLVIKILMWAISNVHAARIWSAGRRFPIPDLDTVLISIFNLRISTPIGVMNDFCRGRE